MLKTKPVVVAGSMHNTVVSIDIETRTDCVKDLIISVFPRIDCGFNQLITIYDISKKDIIALRDHLNKMLEQYE